MSFNVNNLAFPFMSASELSGEAVRPKLYARACDDSGRVVYPLGFDASGDVNPWRCRWLRALRSISSEFETNKLEALGLLEDCSQDMALALGSGADRRAAVNAVRRQYRSWLVRESSTDFSESSEGGSVGWGHAHGVGAGSSLVSPGACDADRELFDIMQGNSLLIDAALPASIAGQALRGDLRARVVRCVELVLRGGTVDGVASQLQLRKEIARPLIRASLDALAELQEGRKRPTGKMYLRGVVVSVFARRADRQVRPAKPKRFKGADGQAVLGAPGRTNTLVCFGADRWDYVLEVARPTAVPARFVADPQPVLRVVADPAPVVAPVPALGLCTIYDWSEGRRPVKQWLAMGGASDPVRVGATDLGSAPVAVRVDAAPVVDAVSLSDRELREAAKLEAMAKADREATIKRWEASRARGGDARPRWWGAAAGVRSEYVSGRARSQPVHYRDVKPATV